MRTEAATEQQPLTAFVAQMAEHILAMHIDAAAQRTSVARISISIGG